jgi:ribosomal protein S12 methylthiotransferase
MGNGRYWLHTLGCPKNQVDSEKLAGRLLADGYVPASAPVEADLVVVNTCAFIEAARQESIEVVLDLASARRKGARLVVTGCMAERYGDELAAALPEVDLVAGFGVALVPPAPSVSAASRIPVYLGPARPAPHAAVHPVGDAPAPAGRVTVGDAPAPLDRSFDLLELPRPAAGAPWAYVKVAEGCDRICGFCAIPSFRGRQRSRAMDGILREVSALAEEAGAGAGAREIVLVAQDLASYGRDRATGRARPGGGAPAPIVTLVQAVSDLVPRTRLLYLYPSGLTDDLVAAHVATGGPHFPPSLPHVPRPRRARLRRGGDGARSLRRIGATRRAEPAATCRSSFNLGSPGETEEDHDALLAFLREAQLDWAGFFSFSPEEGTHAVGLPDQIPPALAMERLRECAELQDAITARRRDELVGETRQVLVDSPGVARTVHEAPEIDGVVHVPTSLPVGTLVEVVVTGSLGTDLVAAPTAAVPGPGSHLAAGHVSPETSCVPALLETPATPVTAATAVATRVRRSG